MLFPAMLMALLVAAPVQDDLNDLNEKSAKTEKIEKIEPSERSKKAGAPKQDPFEADEKVRRVLSGQEREDGFVPLDGGVALPAMKLKGLVKMKGKSTTASVEIDGIGSFVVREGEKLIFSLSGRVVKPSGKKAAGAVEMREQIPIALLVTDISRDGVIVEVGTLGETMIIK